MEFDALHFRDDLERARLGRSVKRGVGIHNLVELEVMCDQPRWSLLCDCSVLSSIGNGIKPALS